MDWDLTLALAARSMHLERWIMAPLQVAPCLALCARALADSSTRGSRCLARCGLCHLSGAQRLKPAAEGDRAPQQSARTANFVLTAMHETGDIVAAALGDERRRALRTEGAAMSMDEAVTYALANIDPKLLTGPIASIDR